ncbi:MAG: TonB-dependent receptor [Bacteroidetes bacterium]|jgi:iron complex outermembrane receptor protein|nr:TonB-dependent receptor [Bacteroidota bacterium]
MTGLRRILLFILAVTATANSLSAQISGRVVDESGAALPGATVQLTPDTTIRVTGLDGVFIFPQPLPGKHYLQVSYVGYESVKRTVQVESSAIDFGPIVLQQGEALLETVVVTEEHAKQEGALATDHFTGQVIEENLQGTFAQSIDKLPGMSAINIGVGIAKPVIRGLSSNRIIVNNQGIKQEGHQWGADHGLEIDQFGVERVEIVKGPASLQYGSDGLGGVINIMPGRIPPEGTIVGSVLGVHKTNNAHWGGSANLSLNIDGVFAAVRYSHQDFADYRVPAEQFTYNSFTLPIFDQQLKNTAGQERNYSATVGLNRSWGVTRLTFSEYRLEAGLFSGAVGIPRSYALQDDGNARDIDIPKQEVRHTKLSLHQDFVLENGHINLNFGYQRNLRQEFSFPEFHSIPSSQIDPGNTLGLQFDLQTYSANLHYEREYDTGWRQVHGGNVQWQDNRRAGFEFLLPNFRTFRAGVFSLVEKRTDSGWLLNGGLRFDYATNDTEFFRQWVWDSNENITDSLIAPETTPEFFNWSASVGGALPLWDGRTQLKLNFGKSFRVPYPAETVSNGIHHGTFRHEVGTPGLESEHGYQLDASMNWDKPRFSGSLAAYFNYFDNYIYLGPTFPARFSPLPESGQIFQYRQDDAIYTGFEAQYDWSFLPNWRLSQTADFVQSYNIRTQLALPFTPQPTVQTSLRYTLPERNGWLQSFYAELNHQYALAAEGRYRIDRSERATPAYQLWGAAVGFNFHGPTNAPIRLNLQLQNAFDTFYLNHLSRYRLINVPEQGRNLVVSLKVPFSGRLKN